MTRKELKQLIKETMEEAMVKPAAPFYMIQVNKGSAGYMSEWTLWTTKKTLDAALKEKQQFLSSRGDSYTEKDVRVIECKVVG